MSIPETYAHFLEKNPCEIILVQAAFAGFDLKMSV